MEPVGITKEEEYVTVVAEQVGGYVGEIVNGPLSQATLAMSRNKESQPTPASWAIG